jgi:hypothetical protein
MDLLEFEPNQKLDYSIMMGFIEYFENPGLIIKRALSNTNRSILISFPVSGGFLAFQRKLRDKRRCYLRLYSYDGINNLIEGLNVRSCIIERIQRDIFCNH